MQECTREFTIAEMTISELISDPMIRLMMEADKVNVAAVVQLLESAERVRKLQQKTPALAPELCAAL